jgi:hypothetical protein
MKFRSPLSGRTLRVALLAAPAVALVIWGCSKNPLNSTGESPLEVSTGGLSTDGMLLSPSHPEVAAVMAIQDRSTAELFEVAGVEAVGTGMDERGKAVIKVFTEFALHENKLPKEIDGARVVQEVSGKIVAMKGGGGGGTNHRGIQTPPIQLGCSGGPAGDLANGYCCGGTLGALVSKGGNQYILSNSHVFAGDVVNGGNGVVSAMGDDISQPGLIDVNCNANSAQDVADLSSLSTLYPPNGTPNVDCAIAQVRPGMVRTDGAILGIGTISASPIAASVGQAVKKSGRTTGLTRSSVSAINATVNVGYSTECGGSSFTKQFTGQIMISNRSSRFLNSGDSGSLMVQDVTTNPRPIGLLFAGSSSVAIANPIGAVLSHLGASMVGN